MRDQAMALQRPHYRADTVGSFLRPQSIHAARARYKSGEIDAPSLRAIEDAAIRDVVRMQETLGFGVVTDGEFRRENWYVDFVRRLDGVTIEEGSGPSFAQQSAKTKYVPKQVKITGKVLAKSPIVVGDYNFLASVTGRSAKVTIPSPTRLHFHGGRRAVSREIYPDIEIFFADVAAVYQQEIAALEVAGCRYIQIDDPLLSYFLSPELRAEVVGEGDDPDQRLVRYVQLVNDCIRLRRPETTIGIHICRGNARSSWIAQGAYDGIAEICFGGLAADRFLLEFDDERSGSFEPLRYMPKDKQVVLGLVTTKHARLESRADLMRRIDDAARFVDSRQLAISPQCGFASVVEGNLITPEDQLAKLTLVVETAQNIWNSN
jgi:5-methyltetrahydropteroyltriglutamate--homocysteine methyltransferase